MGNGLACVLIICNYIIICVYIYILAFPFIVCSKL